MKEIFYSQNNTFLLTDEEYKIAISAWDKKKNFICSRLDNAALSPHFQFTRTPLEDQGCEVFILFRNNNARKVFKNGKIYSMNFVENGKTYKSGTFLTDEEIKKLIPQEEYFKNVKITGHGQSA